MRILCKLGILSFAISSLFLVPSLCMAQPATSYIIVVRPTHPDGELNAITCAENERSCSLEVRLTSSGEPLVKVGVLISSGKAYFKFEKGIERLQGNNQPHFNMPLGGDHPTQETVTLYPPIHIEGEEREGILQTPVLRYSHNPIAEVEITVVSTKN